MRVGIFNLFFTPRCHPGRRERATCAGPPALRPGTRRAPRRPRGPPQPRAGPGLLRPQNGRRGRQKHLEAGGGSVEKMAAGAMMSYGGVAAGTGRDTGRVPACRPPSGPGAPGTPPLGPDAPKQPRHRCRGASPTPRGPPRPGPGAAARGSHPDPPPGCPLRPSQAPDRAGGGGAGLGGEKAETCL